MTMIRTLDKVTHLRTAGDRRRKTNMSTLQAAYELWIIDVLDLYDSRDDFDPDDVPDVTTVYVMIYHDRGAVCAGTLGDSEGVLGPMAWLCDADGRDVRGSDGFRLGATRATPKDEHGENRIATELWCGDIFQGWFVETPVSRAFVPPADAGDAPDPAHALFTAWTE